MPSDVELFDCSAWAAESRVDRVAEQNLCGAVVLRAVLDALSNRNIERHIRAEAVDFILCTSGLYSFDWFAHAAGISERLILRIKERAKDGKASYISTENEVEQYLHRAGQARRRQRERAAAGLQRNLFKSANPVLNSSWDDNRGSEPDESFSRCANASEVCGRIGDKSAMTDLEIVQAVIRAVSYVSGYPAEDICGKCRRQAVVKWRHFAMYEAYRCSKLSTVRIGQIFGRDHSSVLHAINKGKKHYADKNDA